MAKWSKNFTDLQVRLGDGRVVILPSEAFEIDYYKADQKIRRFRVVTMAEAERRIAAGWVRTEEKWQAPKSLEILRQKGREHAEELRYWATLDDKIKAEDSTS